MKSPLSLTSIAFAGVLSLSAISPVALAEPSDTAKVDATELMNELNLHPTLGQYGLSVVAHDDDSLSIEGTIDDQRAYDALNQFLDEKTEANNDWEIANNVVNS